jgi:8-oxo-dGTP pyrophosphatase MutT (NUDIX family)
MAARVRPRGEPVRPDRPSEAALAAGAVVVRRPSDEILLLHHAAEDRWCFPKGHVEPGETLIEAAAREIEEETGLAGLAIERELGESHYRFYEADRDRNVFKTSVYFLAVAPERTVRLESTFDRYRWCSVAEAERFVGYDDERRMIRAARAALRPPSAGRRPR